MTDVWVRTGEAEFSDGGIVRTFDSIQEVYADPDTAWAAIHEGWVTEGHRRFDYEGAVTCSRCTFELVRVTVIEAREVASATT